MKVKKIIIILICLLFIFFFLRLGAYMMSPGSNSRAEYYRVHIPTDQIIEKVAEFKERYPEYKYTRLDRDGNPFVYMEDGPTAFYLHLPSLDISVTCIIRQVGKEYFVGLSSAEGKPIPPGGGSINTGKIPHKQNQEIKKVFEEKFLNHIGTWERVDTGNSFFGLYF